MFSRRNTSSSVSRTTSFSDRGSLDIERTSSVVQTVNLNGSGRRTMSLEEEDEDDDNVWNKIHGDSGPLSATSDLRSDDVPPTTEVTILRISNLVKGCTTTQLYKAFQVTKEEMRIEVQAADQALLHFEKPDLAMKAYFVYLASTSSLGTVSPYEADIEALSSSPDKYSSSALRNRRSFQGSTTMLSALSNISSWRSSDKLHTLNAGATENQHRLGHRSSSSRSSVNSRSAERIPSLGKQATSGDLAMTQLVNELHDNEKPLTMHAISCAKPATSSLRNVSTPVAQSTPSETKHLAKATASAKRFLSLSLGLRSSKSTHEKDEKGGRKTKTDSNKASKKEVEYKSKR